ncbi:hypothetical protein ACHWQZ_G013043 [Mnemiopsis leidyi]
MNPNKTSLTQKPPAVRQSPRNLQKLNINNSPSASTSGTPSPTSRLSISSPSSPNPVKKNIKRSSCPCGRSSNGKDWLIACSENGCKQHWHSSCGNLKGENSFTQAQVDCLTKQWLCPWCYTVPFAKPGNHPTSLNEISLIEKALSSAAYQNITDSVMDVLKNAPPAIDLSSMETRLDELTTEIKNFKKTSSGFLAPSTFPRAPPIHEKRDLNCQEKPFESYEEKFLADDDLDSMVDLLGYLKSSASFLPEKGHEVKLYGEPYSYTGAKDLDPDPIPPELTKIVDLLSSKFSLSEQERPNSILINFFPATNGLDTNNTHLAMHSDDESSIAADSKIITLSIGAKRKIKFEAKHSNESLEELEVSDNSVYIMSRKSQNWFRHGVPPPSPGESTEERFSITFRCLKKQLSRSILLIGDSNTKQVTFGSGLGKVGQSFPGKRIKAAKVKDIEAKDCVGYSNIFIMCGTNDLRCGYISDERDIHCVVETLKDKLIQVKQLCPEAKIDFPDEISLQCKRSKRTVAKVLQLKGFETFPLLSQHCDIEIVHLIRDPRASIKSRMDTFGKFLAEEPDVVDFTQDHITDSSKKICGEILARAELIKNCAVAKTRLSLLYEDVLVNPLEKAKELFGALQIKWREEVEQRVNISTSGSLSEGGGFGTVKNTAKLGQRWKRDASKEFITSVEQGCSVLLHTFHYTPMYV